MADPAPPARATSRTTAALSTAPHVRVAPTSPTQPIPPADSTLATEPEPPPRGVSNLISQSESSAEPVQDTRLKSKTATPNPNAALPPGAYVVTVEVHLSTFKETLLSRERLDDKAEDVKNLLQSANSCEGALPRKLDSLNMQLIKAGVEAGKAFLPNCQLLTELDKMAPARSKPFLSPEDASKIYNSLKRNILVLSYCWQLNGVPDPDGAVLAKIRERLKALQDTERRRAAQEKREPDDVGLFVDAACLPQTFALANGQCDGAWHCDCSRVARLRSNDVAALGPVKTDRFGAEGDGQLRVLKFIWDKNDPIENAEEAEVCVGQIRSLCSEEEWDLACVSDFKGSGLRNAPCPCGSGREFKACCAQGGGDRDIEDGDGGVGDSARRVGDGSGILGWDWSLKNHGASHSSFISQGEGQGTAGQSSRQRSVRILFHERYASGESRFDRTSKAEGFILFCSEVDARKAQRNEALVGLCGGQRPELIGESVFDNDLKFRRGLSVMGCLYASPAGTSVMQLTAPPAEDGNVSGKVKTSQRDHSAHCRELISKRTGSVFVLQVPDDADRDEGIKQLRAQLEKRKDVLACVDLLDRKDYSSAGGPFRWRGCGRRGWRPG